MVEAPPKAETAYVVLTGNPNCGKTTLFNALTGLRAKVGNYAGVTVERKEGKLIGALTDNNIRVLDLPGTYSLSPNSIDEQVSRDVLLHRLPCFGHGLACHINHAIVTEVHRTVGLNLVGAGNLPGAGGADQLDGDVRPL